MPSRIPVPAVPAVKKWRGGEDGIWLKGKVKTLSISGVTITISCSLLIRALVVLNGHSFRLCLLVTCFGKL